MEISVCKWIAVCSGLVVVILGWRLLNWVWLKPRKVEKYLRKQGLKGSSYKLLFGDMKEMGKMINEAKSKPISISDDILPRALPFVHEAINSYGKISFIWQGPYPMVYVTDPALVKDILLRIDEFPRLKIDNLYFKGGLFNYEGQKWAKHRKLINPAFHAEKLKLVVPAVYLCCTEMISKWEEMLPLEEGSSCEVDVWPYIKTLSGDVLSRSAFGSSLKEGRRIFEIHTKVVGPSVEAINSFYIPGSRFFAKRYKRMKELDKEGSALIRNIINKRLKGMKAGGISSNDDLLGVLLESTNRAINDGDNNYGMSIDEVIQHCKLFYFAGQETTANLLVWTMILLAQHPVWQENAREEVFHVFGKNKPDVDGLSRLKVVNMILNEVLRLYPPAIQVGRMVNVETKLGEVTLPAGTLVSLPIIELQHDHELWGDDAKEFKPQRFSEGVSKASKGQSSYFPFGWGPRICIGQNFALLEAKMALAMILQHFSFVLSPSYSHGPNLVLALEPQYGAHLILRKL